MAPTIFYFTLVVSLRLLWVFAFAFIHPFFALLGSLLPDTIDADALWYWAPLGHAFYEQSDKLVDAVHLVGGAAFCGAFWHELWYAPWLFVCALFRLVGNVVFLCQGGTVHNLQCRQARRCAHSTRRDQDA